MIRFYNTLTREKEDFVPLVPGKVGIYSCGPTVYDYVHIGNLTSFLFADILKRWLEFSGFEVKHVMNLTDVDDKTIKASRKEGISLSTLTGRYTDAFLADLRMLNIKPATIYPRATDHIPEMVEIIKVLMEKGNAYRGSDGSIYYRISSFPAYGRLAGDRMNRSDESGRNAYAGNKENDLDFVLWKAYKPEEDGDVFWNTEIGKGRPGWHIECSAMSTKHLGPTFDIHTGGIDLIFPHHQNEIAQSEAYSGQTFVRFWMHHEFLRLNEDEEKMSKSAGGILKLKDIVSDLDDALAFRYLRFSTHYRTPLTFSNEVLRSAKNSFRRLRRLRQKIVRLAGSSGDSLDSLIVEARSAFIEKMNDDLNTPQALAVLFSFVGQVEEKLKNNLISPLSAKEIVAFMDEIDSVLGVINVETPAEKPLDITMDQFALICRRNVARDKQDWQESDRIRDLLLEQGIGLKDEKGRGSHWYRIDS